MKTKNLLLATALILGTSLMFTSCSKDKGNNEDPIPVAPVTPSATYTLSGNITSNMTLTKDQVWYLDGRVIVQSPTELTIEAGTVIKGKEGQDASASVLIIAPGAKIHATGTSSEPIVFTSELDNITPGNVMTSNLSTETNNLWGGVIILGNAPISAGTGGTLADVEGIPAGTASYGGSNPSDNSGEFQYCSIRHGGVVIGNNNEINGLTLGGVGTGTQIDHVEIVGNVDDGIEFFGGSVNLTDVVIIYQGDDGIDIDQSYSGSVTNYAIFIGANTQGDAHEIDGPEDSGVNATGLFTLDKGYVVGNSGNSAKFAVLKSEAQGTLKNCFFTNFPSTAVIQVRGQVEYDNYIGTGAQPLNITGNVFNTTSLTGLFSSTIADYSAGTTKFETDGLNSTGAVATNGFDATQFAGWSWASSTGLLN
tara:strand:+ start:1771 stop:3036 length:1266 start_codon:yes stop_codon:yes gene_type:complete